MDVSGMTLNDPRAAVSGVRFGGTDPDRALLVRFFKQPRKLDSKSDDAGRPVFDSVVMIRVDSPGDRTTSLVRRARVGAMTKQYGGTDGKTIVDVRDDDDDARRFPAQWAAFQRDADQNVDGTPLKELRFLTIEQIAEYQASKVFSAEQLAAIADSSLTKLPLDARKHREQAKAYIDAALGNAPLMALAGETDRLKETLASKDALINDLAERLAKLEQKSGGKSSAVPPATA